jgi:hypothetical protein
MRIREVAHRLARDRHQRSPVLDDLPPLLRLREPGKQRMRDRMATDLDERVGCESCQLVVRQCARGWRHFGPGDHSRELADRMVALGRIGRLQEPRHTMQQRPGVARGQVVPRGPHVDLHPLGK